MKRARARPNQGPPGFIEGTSSNMFNSSFDGSTKRQRHVSMGGKKRDEGKAATLARARQERKAREAERLRLRAGELIQRRFRGHRSACRTANDRRREWDGMMNNLNQIVAVFRLRNATFDPPFETLTALIRPLVFFYGFAEPSDRVRLMQICPVIRSSLKTDAAPSNFLHAGLVFERASQEFKCWFWRFRRLLCIVIRQIQIDLESGTDPTGLVESLTDILGLIGGHDAGMLLGLSMENSGPTLVMTLRALRRFGAVDVHGPARLVSTMLVHASQGSGSSPFMVPGQMLGQLLVDLFVQHPSILFEAREFQDLHAVMNPSTWWRLLRSCVEHLALHKDQDDRSATAGAGPPPPPPPPPAAAAAPWPPGKTEADTLGVDRLTRVACVATGLFALLPGALADREALVEADMAPPAFGGRNVDMLVSMLDAIRPGIEMHSMADESAEQPKGAIAGDVASDDVDFLDDDDDDAAADSGQDWVKGLQGIEMLLSRELRRRAHSHGADKCALSERIWREFATQAQHPRFVSFIFQHTLPRSGEPDAASSPHLPGHATHLRHVCRFFGAMLVQNRRRDRLASNVLNVFTLGKVPMFLPRLWSSLGEQVDSLKAGAGVVCLGESLPALFLFFAVYSRNLLALDDDEVFERGIPIARDMQRDVVAVLHSVLVDMLWDHPVVSDQPDSLPSTRLANLSLLHVAVKLFNQLYDRNARRSFQYISRGRWLWPDTPLKELTDVLKTRSSAPSFGSGRSTMVLTCIPQVVPFEERVLVFHRLIEDDKRALGLDGGFVMGSVVHDLTVRRETIYADAMRQLNGLGPSLKGRVRVSFESELGYQEAGIDGGGLFKDFMDALSERAFDPQYGMFNSTTDHLLHPNPMSGSVQQDHLEHFEFMGRVLGKAIYSQILVKPQFATFFLNKLLGRNNHIDDLFTLDAELYRNLMSLKTFARSGGDISQLTLNFTVAVNCFGKQQDRELVPGGANIVVDNSNYFEYQFRLANFKLNRETAQQSRAFLRGFHDIINIDWIRMFDAHELQMVIGGETRMIDVENLRQNMHYGGGYHESQPIIQWFWATLRSCTPQQQGDFLKFVTGSSRQPLLGFEYMSPPICIQKVPVLDNGIRLPTAATCMNLLKLPDYEDEDTLKEKLLYAISSNAGFELS